MQNVKAYRFIERAYNVPLHRPNIFTRQAGSDSDRTRLHFVRQHNRSPLTVTLLRIRMHFDGLFSRYPHTHTHTHTDAPNVPSIYVDGIVYTPLLPSHLTPFPFLNLSHREERIASSFVSSQKYNSVRRRNARYHAICECDAYILYNNISTEKLTIKGYLYIDYLPCIAFVVAFSFVSWLKSSYG